MEAGSSWRRNFDAEPFWGQLGGLCGAGSRLEASEEDLGVRNGKGLVDQVIC